MGMLTSQKINEYYTRFKAIDVTFSREVIQVTGLIPSQVHLKCVGDFWPCVLFSSSFQGAKLIVSIKSGILPKLERANNMVSLRYSFKFTEKGNPVSFFVNAKSSGYTAYGNSNDMALFSLQFTQRPPDDLIEIMGRILDANVNSAKRREERVTITPEALRKLNIDSKESAIFIQGVPRRCILRDISFSGAKIIMMGVAKFLVEKEAALRMDFEDPRQSFLLRGKFTRSEAVEGRKELVALALVFDESAVPMGYKVRLNDFLSQYRVDSRTNTDAPEKKSSPGSTAAPKTPVTPQRSSSAAANQWPSLEEDDPPVQAASVQAPAPEAESFDDHDFELDIPHR